MLTMNNEKKSFRFPAPWEPQDAVLLVWPDVNTSGQIHVEDVEELYEALIALLVDYVDIILVVPGGKTDPVKERLILMDVPIEYVYFYEGFQHSINIRDFGPFIVESASGFVVLNGLDDGFTADLFSRNAFPCSKLEKNNLYLSWSDIESNGNELILVDMKQLLQKNPSSTESSIKNFLLGNTSAVELLSFDEDISTAPGFVRLGLLNQLLFLHCDDSASSYYDSSKKRLESMHRMNQQLESPMELVSLPWSIFVTDEGTEWIADYSQFIVVNETVLVPIFDLPTDDEAMEIISQSFPGFDIFGFPSRSLAQINTGLFRIIQPVPEGVLEPL